MVSCTGSGVAYYECQGEVHGARLVQSGQSVTTTVAPPSCRCVVDCHAFVCLRHNRSFCLRKWLVGGNWQFTQCHTMILKWNISAAENYLVNMKISRVYI